MDRIFDYWKNASFSVTVCDVDGVVLYQNEVAKGNDGDVVGKNLYLCHSNKSNDKIKYMIKNAESNTYEFIKGGCRFLVNHAPWYDDDGEILGLIEFVFQLPDKYPVFDRDKK